MQQTVIAVLHQAGALAALVRILDRERMQLDLAVHDLRPHLDRTARHTRRLPRRTIPGIPISYLFRDPVGFIADE